MRAFGQVSVPQAIAATAWAPPAFSTCVTPAFLAQYSTSGITCGHTKLLLEGVIVAIAALLMNKSSSECAARLTHTELAHKSRMGPGSLDAEPELRLCRGVELRKDAPGRPAGVGWP